MRLSRYIREQMEKALRASGLAHGDSLYPDVVDKPPGHNVLVLSPHPDDDVIGCGGTLRKHALAGDRITSLYLTDGRLGDPGASSKDALVGVRRREAQRASGIVGVSETIFWDCADGQLAAEHDRRIPELAAVMDERSIDMVYAPAPGDNHADHLAANAMLASCLMEKRFHGAVWAYEVWTPLIPNILVDISEVADCKVRAISAHRSQVKHRDYPAIILGLNKYRTVTSGKIRGYAEAFFFASADDYLDLWERYGRKIHR